MINLNELRKTNLKDLAKKFHDLDKEIAIESFHIQSRRSTKTAQLRAMKKDLARIATVINELKLLSTIHGKEEK